MIGFVLRGLARRPWRFAFTGGGVALAACGYMVLVGSAARFVNQFHDLSPVVGTDLVVQRKDAGSPVASGLPDGLAAQLREVPGVMGVSRAAFGRTRLSGSSWFLVVGLDAREPVTARLPVEEGRGLQGGGEIVFGASAAAARGLRSGSVVEFLGQSLRVAGIFKSRQAFLDAAAIVELRDAQRFFGLPGTFNIALVDLAPGVPSSDVANRIASRFSDVEVTTLPGLVGNLALVRIAQGFAHLVGLLAVAIAALGAANVLALSVQERTEEIAVLRSVGWRRSRIAALVLTEGVTVSVAGVLMALPLTAVALLVLGRVGPGAELGLVPAYPPLAAALEALAVTTLATVFGAIPPMVRALRIAPASAFRST
jgi:ABC-type antimicrobial peptide transport system permease subunit